MINKQIGFLRSFADYCSKRFICLFMRYYLIYSCCKKRERKLKKKFGKTKKIKKLQHKLKSLNLACKGYYHYHYGVERLVEYLPSQDK